VENHGAAERKGSLRSGGKAINPSSNLLLQWAACGKQQKGCGCLFLTDKWHIS